MFHRFLPLATLTLAAVCLPAQAQVQQEAAGTVRGRIVDSVTGRPVPSATVRLVRGDRAQETVDTDANGAFSFDRVPEGVYSVEVEEQGYLKAVQSDVRVVLRRAAAVEFALVRGSGEELSEVIVSARATTEDLRATPNTVSLDREEIRRNPGSAGDVLRALDVLPGVVSTGEFSSFTVRGNGPRDNLVLIDGIPFDKVAHFDESLGEQEAVDGGGRYSIFAPNLIGNARFSPGAWRAAEGGRNGSLLELEIADGNPVSSTAGARVDIIGIEADYDGPSYVADNTSLLLSARSFDFGRLFDAIVRGGHRPAAPDGWHPEIRHRAERGSPHRAAGHPRRRGFHTHGRECARVRELRRSRPRELRAAQHADAPRGGEARARRWSGGDPPRGREPESRLEFESGPVWEKHLPPARSWRLVGRSHPLRFRCPPAAPGRAGRHRNEQCERQGLHRPLRSLASRRTRKMRGDSA